MSKHICIKCMCTHYTTTFCLVKIPLVSICVILIRFIVSSIKDKSFSLHLSVQCIPCYIRRRSCCFLHIFMLSKLI